MSRTQMFAMVGAIAAAILLFVFIIFGRNTLFADSAWAFEAHAHDLRRVDNLALADDGSLYASLEVAGGQGRIVHLKSGQVTPVLEDLKRPDGLILRSGSLFVTEEVDPGRILKFDLATGESITIAQLRKPEGIGFLPDGRLVISEDLPENGRVVALSDSGTVSVIIDGLKKPEGLAVAANGDIFVAESGAGRVIKFSKGQISTVVDGLNWPDQVVLAPDGALWITEDSKTGRLIRFHGGQTVAVLSNVKQPQGIAIAKDWVYVAEQGRDRILRLRTRASLPPPQ